VEPTFKYRAYPETEEDEESALYQINLNREVYNHALTQYYNPAPDNDKPTYTTLQNKLPRGNASSNVEKAHSKALQMAVRRIYWARDALDELKAKTQSRRVEVEETARFP